MFSWEELRTPLSCISARRGSVCAIPKLGLLERGFLEGVFYNTVPEDVSDHRSIFSMLSRLFSTYLSILLSSG